MITPEHFSEWLASGVEEDIIRLNVRSRHGQPALDLLFISDTIPRRNDGRVREHILNRYRHVEHGGWWCSGLDPLDNWEPMEWGQFKPDNPRKADGKLLKYESPPRTPTRAYFLRVPLHIWQKISRRYNKPMPDSIIITDDGEAVGFWAWAIANNLPIVITEGAKKAGALLTAGYVANAIPGIFNGYRQPKSESGQPQGSAYLIPELDAIAKPERQIYLCFDREDKQKTVVNLNIAISKTGGLLTKKGCSVRVVVWDAPQKGVDDLIAAYGEEYFRELYQTAPTFDNWKALTFSQLTYPASITLQQKRLGLIEIPDTAKLIGIKSAKNTGKTWLLERYVEQAIAQGKWVLVIGHRVQLVEALCQRFGINYITEVRSSETGALFGYGLCIDSLHPESQARFVAENWNDGVVIVDEAEQVIWHGLNSTTCQYNRVPILKELRTLLTNILQGDGRVFLADADLSDLSVDYVQGLCGLAIDPFIILNQWMPGEEERWNIHHYAGNSPAELVAALVEHIRQGGKPLVLCSAQKIDSKWGTQVLEAMLAQLFPDLKILRIDSESVSDPSHPAYGCIANLNVILAEYHVAITSPSIETGVSIDILGHFTSVWGIFQGVQSVNSVCQMLARLREPVDRHIWIAKYGIGRIGNGSTSVKSLLASQHKLVKSNIALLSGADFSDDIDTQFQPISLQTWAKMAARINLGMGKYRQSVLAALQNEGQQIVDAVADGGDRVKEEISQLKDELHFEEAVQTSNSPDIERKEYQQIHEKKAKTKEERRKQRKHELQMRYEVDVTPDLVLKDDSGWYPQIRLHYYLTVGRAFLVERDRQKLREQLDRGQGNVFIPDVNRVLLITVVTFLETLGLAQLLCAIATPGAEIRGTDPALLQMEAIAKTNRWAIKAALNLTISPKDSSVAIAQKLLGKLGLRLHYLRREGSRESRVRVYGYAPPGDGRDEVFAAWDERDTQAAVSTPCNIPISTPPLDTDPNSSQLQFGEADIADCVS